MTDDNAWIVFFYRFVDEFGIAGHIEFVATAFSVSWGIYGDDGASGFLKIGKGFFPSRRIAFPTVNQKDFGVISCPGIGLKMMFVMMESLFYGVLKDFGKLVV